MKTSNSCFIIKIFLTHNICLIEKSHETGGWWPQNRRKSDTIPDLSIDMYLYINAYGSAVRLNKTYKCRLRFLLWQHLLFFWTKSLLDASSHVMPVRNLWLQHCRFNFDLWCLFMGCAPHSQCLKFISMSDRWHTFLCLTLCKGQIILALKRLNISW